MAPSSSDTFFTPYNGVPGYEQWVRFERDLFKYGGTADEHGWSYTDVFRGIDDGGNLGLPLPALPGTADDRAVVRLRRKRNRAPHTSIWCGIYQTRQSQTA